MRVSIFENRNLSVKEGERQIAGVLNDEGYRRASTSITGWPHYQVTDLVSLPDVAEHLGVASVRVKDESTRMGLGSFKALGGAYAVQQAFEAWRDQQSPDDRDPANFTVTCVTDGNHGLSVAWGAQQLGCRCVIYIPDVVTEFRESAIRAYGAEVVRRAGNYDNVTTENAADAQAQGWYIVTDTAAEAAAVESAVMVMQGYRVLAEELVGQTWDERPTHVFLQAGCGGMAAAIVGHLVSRLPEAERPVFVVVEPERAACLQESARTGAPVRVEGNLDTMMAGLSVGEVSLPAWDVLRPSVRFFLTVSDDAVPASMRMLARPTSPARRPVTSGETGAAGLAALLAAASNNVEDQLDLNSASRVLLLSTEGDTDPALYRQIVGEDLESAQQSSVAE